MKRMIKSATNTCNISAKPSTVTGSDADRVEYSTDEWEWLATKDVPDSDGFITNYSLYRNRDTGLYVTVFGDRDLYGPEDGEYDYECENEQEAWDWFDSYEPLWDDDYSDIYSSTLP